MYYQKKLLLFYYYILYYWIFISDYLIFEYKFNVVAGLGGANFN